MQQYLPFTVLKLLSKPSSDAGKPNGVATVLTVYGIETYPSLLNSDYAVASVATVLTVYGIETDQRNQLGIPFAVVATVLTVYGIET